MRGINQLLVRDCIFGFFSSTCQGYFRPKSPVCKICFDKDAAYKVSIMFQQDLLISIGLNFHVSRSFNRKLHTCTCMY